MDKEKSRFTLIQVTRSQKARIENLKIHRKEPIYETVEKILDSLEESKIKDN